MQTEFQDIHLRDAYINFNFFWYYFAFVIGYSYICLHCYRERLRINWLRNGVKVGEGYKLTYKKVQLPNETHNLEGEYMCEAVLGNSKAYGQVNLKINGELYQRDIDLVKSSVFY